MIGLQNTKDVRILLNKETI